MENRITPINYPPSENDGLLFLRALREKKSACAIVGFTDHRVEAFKLDRNRFAIFGLNEMWRYHQPDLFDCWFEIHDYDGSIENFTKPEKEGGDPDHIKGLAAMNNIGMPVFMQTHHPEIPSSVPFPKAFVEADLPDGLGLYKTSCPAWELGLALALGFEEIHLLGIDMAQETEYCLAPDSRVLRADLQWVPAGDLKVGDQVISFDEEPGVGTHGVAERRLAAVSAGSGGGWSGATDDAPTRERSATRQWRLATVEKANRITRPCYRIHLANGTTMVSSAEHRWLTRTMNESVWRQTKDLVTPQHRHPTKLVKVLDVWDEDRSWEAGYLAGLLDGEGWLSQRPLSHSNGHNFILEFSQKENETAKAARLAMEILGIPWSELKGDVVTTFHIKGGRSEIMRVLGQMRPKRLLDKFDPAKLGSMQTMETVAVERIEDVGDQEVIALKTSEATFVAEGFASHNSEQRNCIEFLLGIAVGRGVKIYVPTNSDILHCWGQYAYGQEGEAIASKLKERHKWLHKEHSGYLHRLAGLEDEYKTKRRNLDSLYEDKSGGLESEYKNKKNELLALRFQAEGAIADVEYLQRSWTVRARGWRDSPTTDDRAADERVNAEPLPIEQQIHRRVLAPFVPSAGSDDKPSAVVSVRGSPESESS